MTDETFMAVAIEEAKKAAVVVKDGRIIVRARNTREKKGDPAGHAEINAMRRAARRLHGWNLHDTVLYVTLEPCCMCAGAAVNARVGRIVYGAGDPKGGALGGRLDILAARLNHTPAVTGGVMADECAVLLKDFFRDRR